MFQIPYEYTNLRKINKGLTNDNYLIDIDQETYIVRVPKNDTKHLFNRNAEKEILNQLKDKDFILPTKYYNDGIQVSKYESNLINFEDYTGNDKIKRVASLMKQLHKSEINVDFHFNPIHQISLYYEQLEIKPFNLDNYQDLFDRYTEHQFKPVLTHNDWVEGNICYINDHTVLIDYEYAGMNDAYFDIMSFVTENDLSKQEIKEFILLMFNNKPSSQDLQILAMYRDINNLLWYLWALMMYQFRDDNIYKSIAKIKLKQLEKDYMQALII